MSIREAVLRDAAAMARVSVDSYRAAHRDQIPEQSLMQFTYEESERNWARTLRELSESAEREEYIYVAENSEAGSQACRATFSFMSRYEERDSHSLYLF